MFATSLRKILESESKDFYLHHQKQIIDILLFGSAVKGKETPQDLDLLIIFKEKKEYQLAQELKKSIQSRTKLNVEIILKTYEELFLENFIAREAILAESYSLLNKINFAAGFGYLTRVLFSYQLKGKTSSERTRFYYALYGRGFKGVLENLNAQKYAETVILCPLENQMKMREFLESWKVEFKEISLLMPQRLVG